MKKINFFWLALALIGCHSNELKTQTSSPASPQIVSVKKIWDAGQHNAFTDLTRFQGKWFCTFRESEAHVGGNGKIRVLSSTDGEKWKSTALLAEDGIDLRDPKLSITPDKRLMLVLGGSVYDGKVLKERQPRVAFSKDGNAWTSPQRIMAKGDWLWRITWHEGRAYGISYITPAKETSAKTDPDWIANLVESDDGINFRFVTKLDVPGQPNEATLRFLDNGDVVALVRREGPSVDRVAWIGVSSPPYHSWKWKPAGTQIGGPNFIVLPDRSMIGGGRLYNPAPKGAQTFIGRMDLQSVAPQLILPSGGDCSYPGLVWHAGLLWVSYYSSHEGQTCIYLAKVKV